MLKIFSVSLHIDPSSLRLLKALRSGIAVLSLIDLQLVNLNFLIFADDLCLFQIHLKPVGSRRISRRRHKYAGCPVRILQIRRHIVFYLNIMPFALVAEGLNRLRHAADPLNQIQIMRTLV